MRLHKISDVEMRGGAFTFSRNLFELQTSASLKAESGSE